MLGNMAAIFAGSPTFLKLADSVALHGVAAGRYALIRREIEELQASPRNLRGDVRATLAAIRQNMNKASQNAPQLNELVWARMAQRFGVNEPPLHEVMQAARQGTPPVPRGWKMTQPPNLSLPPYLICSESRRLIALPTGRK